MTDQKYIIQFNRLLKIKQLYFQHPDGLTDKEARLLLKIPRASMTRYRIALGAVEVTPGRWAIAPTEDDLEFASLAIAYLWEGTFEHYLRRKGFYAPDQEAGDDKPFAEV